MAERAGLPHQSPTKESGRNGDSRRGAVAAALCFVWWGIVPLYWYALRQAPLAEVIAHRCVWSFVLVLPVLWLSGRMEEVRAAMSGRSLALLCCSAGILTVNWGIFVGGVAAGHALEISLGNFILPLFNVLLGVMVFRDKPRPLQWLAVAIAGVGVAVQVLSLGKFPWLAVGLAATFSCYGCLRKLVRVEALPGLLVENIVLFLPALAVAGWFLHTGQSILRGDETLYYLPLLMGAGALTSGPFALYAYGVRHISLITLGLLSYLVPTGNFILAIFVFNEPFTRGHGVTFALIWAAIAVYTADSLRALKTSSGTAPAQQAQ